MTPGFGLVRRRLVALAAVTAALVSLLPDPAMAGSRSAVIWSDVDGSWGWARKAINLVGAANDWMRDFAPNDDGTYPFQPATIETRKYFARSVVQAFAPNAPVDPSIVLPDLDPGDAFYPYVNVAVRLGWMKRTPIGTFGPDRPVTTTTAHRALVFALGLRSAARSLNRLHTEDGTTIRVPSTFGSLLLGMRLGLRYNNADESMDVGPRSALSRAQVAYSLARAVSQPSYAVPALAGQYGDVELPPLSPDALAIVQWGVTYVGYPYVWSGEWGLRSPEPSGLGGQAVAGFDCSGLVWWLMRSNDGGAWQVAPPRPYAGWALAERSSADMAHTGGALSFDELQPADLMFYDGNGDGRVDHVDTYIGNGWALDSSSSMGGVTIMWVGDGWYRDHFVHGRRIIKGAGS